jgi:hypothetical protein
MACVRVDFAGCVGGGVAAMPRRSAPLRGIAIDLKSISVCKLHQSRFVTLAAQLTVLCQ